MERARKYPGQAINTPPEPFVVRRTTNVREVGPGILDYVNQEGISYRDRLASCSPGDVLTDYKGHREAIKGIIEEEIESGVAMHPDEYDRQLDANNVSAIGRSTLEATVQQAPTTYIVTH